MDRCPRCRTACAGDAYCSWCGLAVRPAPVRHRARPVTRPPGTVTAARVVLGLHAVGLGVTALIGVAGTVAASSLGAVLPRAGGSGTLVVALAALAVASLGCAAIDLWAVGAVAARRASGRTAATLVQAVGLLVGLLLVALAGTGLLGSVLVSLPLGVATLTLLWAPGSSRRWFADGPDTEVLVLPRRRLELH